ncbi:MAG: ribonuclease III [Puniceicoccaceae bacterium]
MESGEPDLSILEERIGYTFTDRSLLVRGLTHPSFTTGSPEEKHNQRLEFLGDAVLGLVLAEALFTEFPNQREGTLTHYRSMLVKGQQLYELATEIDLGSFLRMGEAEDAQGGRNRASILEDALEAVIGAVYMEAGLEGARSSVLKIFGTLKDRLDAQLDDHNPKGKLQELLQPKLGNDSIEYRVIEESGPDHRKEFLIEVWIGGECEGSGSGNSKKVAEEAAARMALANLQDAQ